MSRKLLIIEDEKDLAKLLKYNLEKEGYAVTVAVNGESGLEYFQSRNFDGIILDIMLPKIDGFDVCRQIRRTSKIPILMLTAKTDVIDKVLSFELGADDFISKPFSIREVIARLEAIFRRVENKIDDFHEPISKIGQLEVDFERYTVRINNKEVKLSSKEFEFLTLLIQSDGKVLTREIFLEKIWGIDRSLDISTRTVDQHIKRLRGKLGSAGDLILTIKNVGYRLKNAS